MSLASVKPYMREVMDGLGYREWDDGFNFENIPSTILDESYHVEAGTAIGSPANQTTFEFTFPVTLRIFLKGFRSPSEAIDEALERGDSILSATLTASSRLSQQGFKNVAPSTVVPLPLDATNDNALILEMEFIFTLIECY